MSLKSVLFLASVCFVSGCGLSLYDTVVTTDTLYDDPLVQVVINREDPSMGHGLVYAHDRHFLQPLLDNCKEICFNDTLIYAAALEHRQDKELHFYRIPKVSIGKSWSGNPPEISEKAYQTFKRDCKSCSVIHYADEP